MAKVLKANLKDGDFAARVGGDEFSLFLGSVETETQAVQVSRRIQTQLAEPVLYGDCPCRFGASIGIAYTSDISAMGDDIQHFADAATYSAKEAGRNRCNVFTPQLHQQIISDRRLAHELQTALERSEFTAVFQPQVAASDHRLVGVETLLRGHSLG